MVEASTRVTPFRYAAILTSNGVSSYLGTVVFPSERHTGELINISGVRYNVIVIEHMAVLNDSLAKSPVLHLELSGK